MNESQIAHFVRQNLNRSARDLPDDIKDRLRRARGHALARQKQSIAGRVLAGFGTTFEAEPQSGQIAAFVAVLLISLACMSYWHAREYIAGLEEVDTAILTDDLPLDAWVDKGFDAWLRSSAEP